MKDIESEILYEALKLLAMDVVALSHPTSPLRPTGSFADIMNEYINRAKKGLNPKYMDWKND